MMYDLFKKGVIAETVTETVVDTADAYVNYGEIIEQYVFDYCEICKSTVKNFNLENIIIVL